jgi:hypothetical protein
VCQYLVINRHQISAAKNSALCVNFFAVATASLFAQSSSGLSQIADTSKQIAKDGRFFRNVADWRA